MNFFLPSPLQKISFLNKNNYFLYIKRDDQIHQYLSGNKWRKLKFNIFSQIQQKKNTLFTMGGAYSNHIMACAAAANLYHLKSIGIIRGEELDENANANLKYAASQGMQLYFVDRATYAKRYDSNFVELICKKFNIRIEDIYFVPEGGANALAEKGCSEIVDEIHIDFDYIITACGTGTTMLGLSRKLQPHQKIIGIDVLKNNFDLDRKIKNSKQAQLIHDYHFGGYGKKNDSLVHFINTFYTQHNIKLDYVYTGKMMFALFDLMNKAYFKPNATIVALHTGGILNANCIVDDVCITGQ